MVAGGWNRFGLSEQFWAGTMILTGIFISLSMLFRRGDYFFNLVVIWALFGIVIKRVAEPSEPSQIVLLTSVFGIIVIFIGIIFLLVKKKWYA
jgi:hypothetical protein